MMDCLKKKRSLAADNSSCARRNHSERLDLAVENGYATVWQEMNTTEMQSRTSQSHGRARTQTRSNKLREGTANDHKSLLEC